MADLKYFIGFNLTPGIGRAKFIKLERYFGNMKNSWHAGSRELSDAGLDDRSITSILTQRSRISLDDELAKLEKYHVRALTWSDPEYPSSLKEIYDAPPVLYVKGTITSEDHWAVSIVGSRNATIYGNQVAGMNYVLSRQSNIINA
ncbi:DNA-processing protein DprA [Chloroflexota bacterium]